MMTYCELDPKEYISIKFHLKFKSFYSRNAFENIAYDMAAILSRPELYEEK